MNNEKLFVNLTTIVSKLKLRCRVQTKFDSKVSAWSQWLTIPLDGYLETSSTGPLAKADISYIEIEPYIETRMGRLVPKKRESLRSELIHELIESSISFEELGGFVRIVIGK